MTLPLISVCMPTYGRAGHPGRCVDEAVESFLRQDWPNKELIIWNDHPEQFLVFDHPQVKVFNPGYRCDYFAQVRNQAVRAGSGQIVVNFDDDDVYLPHALTAFVEALGSKRYALVRGHWYLERNRVVKFCDFAHQNCVAFTRELFEQVGGYPLPSDSDADQAFSRVVGRERVEVTTSRPFMLYRWADGLFHLSGMGQKFPGDKAPYETMGRLPVAKGRQEIKPVWLRDYVADVAAFGQG